MRFLMLIKFLLCLNRTSVLFLFVCLCCTTTTGIYAQNNHRIKVDSSSSVNASASSDIFYLVADSTGADYLIADSIWIKNSNVPVSIHGNIDVDFPALRDTTRKDKIISDLPPFRGTPNTSYAVGATIGIADVTPTGAATYQIPISIPPGINGVQPNLSIVYNSQSGNGLLGYGWHLSGVSMISRCGKTYYHDGIADGITHGDGDNLMLDGQRLMLISGTNLTNGAEYRTEIETFSEIKIKTNYPQLYFEIKTKDGWKLEYGTTNDSRLRAGVSSGVVAVWLLAKVTDPSGNFMNYSYTNNAATGEFSLIQIEYSGNIYLQSSGVTPNNRIDFEYETRSDMQTSYIAGRTVVQSVRLKKIIVSTADTTFREYKFNYNFDGTYSKLAGVEEYGQGGVRYNSTEISFGNETFVGMEDIIMISSKGSSTTNIYSDFNGDGKTDFICYPNKSSYSSSDVATLYLADDYYGLYFSKTTATIPLISGFEKLLVGDMDGDGLCDMIRVYKSGSTYYYNIYLYKSGSFTHYYTLSSSGKDCLVGDFNGDGRQDLFFKEERTVRSYNNTLIASGGMSAADAGIDYIANVFPNSRYSMNLRGNGKTSILTLSGTGCKVFEVSGSTFVECTGFASSNVKNSDGILPGDYNGDGLTDLLIQRNNSSYYILFSTGTSFTKTTLPNLDLFSLTLPGDINRDGKTEIIQLYVSTNVSGGDAKMHIKKGTYKSGAFSFETYIFSNIPVNSIPMVGYFYDNATGRYIFQPSRTFFTFEDFDGDGRSELMYDWYIDAFFYKSFYDPLRLHVKSITDGLNRITEFTYNPMTSSYVCNENGSNPSFPVIKNRFPLYLVNSMTTSEAGIYSSSYFYYRNPRTHRQGKGFLGFGKVEITNSDQNRKIVTDYGYNTTYYYVYPTQQKVTNYAANTDISTKTFVNTYLLMGTKRIFPYVSSQTSTNHLTGLSVTTSYQYLTSDHGNPWKITETCGDMITVTNNTWEAKGSIFKNRLTNSTVTRSGLDGTFTQTTEMTYDIYGRLTSKIDFKGTAKAVTTTYSNFNMLGNPQTITTKATNCPTISITIGYDSRGRPISKTDATGTSETRYDLFSRVKSVTGINNLKVSYEYDGFGNLVKETYPTGNIVYAKVWDINGNQLYRINQTETGAPSQSAWYNAAGQEMKARTIGFSGEIFTKNEYNTKGQLYRSYLPGHSNPDSRYTEFSYDEFGRLKKEKTFNGDITNYTYTGLTTKIEYPDGTFKTTLLNNSGLVQSITDGGGSSISNTINYVYNSLGEPESITVAGIKTTIKYDYRGYQRALKDPNMTDTIHYEYDAYGMLRSQKNARNQTTTYTYDAAGRMKTEVSPEMNLTYNYATSGAGKGQLEFIKTGSTELRKIEYNTLGMPWRITEKIDGTNYVTKYDYDSYGRLLQKESPSGFQLLHVYNSDGYLKELRDGSNDANLWRANAKNAFGQIISSTSGNGLTRTTTYNTGDLTLQSITLNNGATTMDEVAYIFNPVSGNLQQRNDITNTRNEQFGYDAINRLNSIKLNSAAAQSITYKPNGNIENKYDVGAYSYSKNNHAVTDITLSTSYIPSAFNLQHTSFERTSQVQLVGGGKMTFGYSPDKQRNISRYYTSASAPTPQTTRYYNGTYEKEITGSTTTEYDYVYSPEGLAVIAVTTGGARSLYYVHTDHLGSLRLLTNGSKGIASRYRYDAWGNRTLVAGSNITNRGFTGHEHLPQFGLINMNARLYDPVIGRFLSPDPFVADGTFSQDYNRYMYARNNPLMYTDPDGELVWFVPIIIGAVIGGTSGAIMAKQAGAKGFGQWAAYIGGGALIGGLSGGAAVGIGALGGGAMLAGAAAGAVGGAGFSGMATGWDGQAMLKGAAFGAISGFVGGGFASAIGGGWGALAGGATSNLTSQLLYNGGDFGNVNWASVGFSGALSVGMYHGMQYMQYKQMGGKLGQLDVTYKQYSKINTAYQRSRFWQKEYGIVLNRDGGARIIRGEKYEVQMTLNPRAGEYATAHTHWAREGIDLGNNIFTVGGHHSQQDLLMQGYSMVVGRTTSTYSIPGTGVYHYIKPDPFVRFFLFPFLSLKR